VLLTQRITRLLSPNLRVEGIGRGCKSKVCVEGVDRGCVEGIDRGCKSKVCVEGVSRRCVSRV
jgi:hypothetical protein